MSEFRELKKKIKLFAGKMDEYLLKQLKGEHKEIWTASRHLIEAGGKRLRPFIISQFVKLFNPKMRVMDYCMVAGAVELIHTFSLVHDDIMDEDSIRRGASTVHSKWGIPYGILAGDLLLVKSFQSINQSILSYEMKDKVIGELCSVNVDLCEGQSLDLDFEETQSVYLSDYFEMIFLKTGALFKAACNLAGILTNQSNEIMEHLRIFGEHLGIAFQIVDDILGITANEDKLGKSIGLDVREKKKTFLLLYALENLPKKDKWVLMKIMKKELLNDDDVKKATNLILNSGALEKARRIASDHIKKSQKALKSIGTTIKDDFEGDEETSNIYLANLEKITEFCLERAY